MQNALLQSSVVTIQKDCLWHRLRNVQIESSKGAGTGSKPGKRSSPMTDLDDKVLWPKPHDDGSVNKSLTSGKLSESFAAYFKWLKLIDKGWLNSQA